MREVATGTKARLTGQLSMRRTEVGHMLPTCGNITSVVREQNPMPGRAKTRSYPRICKGGVPYLLIVLEAKVSQCRTGPYKH